MEAKLDQPDSVNSRVFADPCQGVVRWSASKSLWWLTMTMLWLSSAATTASVSSLIVFLILTSTTLCLGHSLGMHRKLIHKAFDCPLWMERLFVYLSTLVGLGGPFTMMRTHDTRDWAQRLPRCHPFLSHQNPIFKDFFWQLHCKLHLENPPRLHYPESIQRDWFYRFLQATSVFQQLRVSVATYLRPTPQHRCLQIPPCGKQDPLLAPQNTGQAESSPCRPVPFHQTRL